MLTLGLAPIVIGLLVVGFLLVSLLMIFIVLIQRPQGGGLSEAFGSNSGSGHTAFGAKTGDALTSATIGIFVLFIVAAIVLNFATRPTQAYQPETEAVPVEEAPAEGAGAPAGNSQPEVVPLSPDEAPVATQGGFALPESAGADDDGADEGADGGEAGSSEEPQTEDAPQ